MLDETRRNLDKSTGELIESFVKFDKNKAIHLKLGLDAINNAQKDASPENKINLYAVCNYDLLHNLLEEHGIPRAEFEKVPQLIESKRTSPEHIESFSQPLREALLNINSSSRPNYDVPTSGMVAVMFNMVHDKIKNALIAGQAGERTLKAIERATTVSNIPVIKSLELSDTLYDLGDTKRLARPYIENFGSEPDYLISAKATNHLADLFESSLKLHPAAKKLDSTVKSMQGFNKLAACIFRNAAETLSTTSAADAAEKIHALAQHIEKSNNIVDDNESALNSMESGMTILREAMQADGIITAEESLDYKNLVSKRIEQIRKMEVV